MTCLLFFFFSSFPSKLPDRILFYNSNKSSTFYLIPTKCMVVFLIRQQINHSTLRVDFDFPLLHPAHFPLLYSPIVFSGSAHLYEEK